MYSKIVVRIFVVLFLSALAPSSFAMKPSAPIKPVGQKIGEGKGNLKGRGDWFGRRHGFDDRKGAVDQFNRSHGIGKKPSKPTRK